MKNSVTFWVMFSSYGCSRNRGDICYLNVIASDSGIDLDDGYLSGRFSSGWGDNIIFVSFSRDTITNVMNGAVMDVDNSCFYSHERDYIFADDISNGNLSEHHWYEPVLEVEGRFSIRIMNGEILLTGNDEVMLFDNSGEQLFTSAVSH